MSPLLQTISDSEEPSIRGLVDDALHPDMFFSPTNGYMAVPQMLADISLFIDEDPQCYYTLIIGTDSQAKHVNGLAEIDFVSAIIIYRRRRGARYFLRKEKQHKKPILRDKIYTET